ncbi:MAG TPA: transglutaminase domain-containing protein, partial [Dehalococcoidia bacterium]|nr:transglutaminase domain-containing protein [Dehalococcoidia bacterium]
GVHSFGRNFPIRSTHIIDTEILLEVTASEVELLRGAAYDFYTGQGWTISQVALEEFDEMGIAAAQFGTIESRNERRQPVKVTVNTRASFSSANRLLTAGEPLASGRPSNILIGPGYSSIGLSPLKRLNVGENYQTVGAESSVSISSLQNSNWVFPEAIKASYTQVPEDSYNSIRKLAETITNGSNTPYEATRRVEDYLRSNYLFSLSTAKINPRSDVVEVFLFDTRQGHFDHFASAMVILLRNSSSNHGWLRAR